MVRRPWNGWGGCLFLFVNSFPTRVWYTKGVVSNLLYMKYKKAVIATVIASVFLLSSCSLGSDQGNMIGDMANKITGGDTQISDSNTLLQQLKDQQRIKRFKDESELDTFLASASQAMPNYGGGVMKTFSAMDVATQEGSTGAIAPNVSTTREDTVQGTGGGNPDYSTTNIQVAGVDEGDIMKSDGHYLYYLHGNTISIVDGSNPSSLQQQATLEFTEQPQGMYVSGDRLVAYGYDYGAYKLDALRSFPRSSSFSFVDIYDVSDKSKPSKLMSYSFEGNYKDSRLIGNNLVFITNAYSYGGGGGLPIMLENEAKVSEAAFPSVYYFDLPYSSVTTTSVLSVNIEKPGDPEREVYLLPSNGDIYVSQNNLYLTYGKYLNEQDVVMQVGLNVMMSKLPDDMKAKLAEVDSTADFILNDSEKLYKKGQLVEQYVLGLPEDQQKVIEDEITTAVKKEFQSLVDEMQKTVIHKISIADGKIEYKAGAEVEGTVLNQFSMDENGDYFRIATTRNQIWSQYLDEDTKASTNNLFVLNKDMQVVGSVKGLANDERIYAVRFMQDRAYIVTFKQVDPLFVLDLKDPKSPKVLGELKVPGFSTYLHPYDATHLIGIGQDADENKFGNVQAQGVKISLFDVSDINNPVENAHYIVPGEGTNSIALNDHKAVLFSKDKNLLVLPITEQKSYQTGIDFQGAMVLTINDHEISLRGKIDHGGLQNDTQSASGSTITEPGIVPGDRPVDYQAQINRSAYIGDTLFTFSQRMLKANNLGDLAELGELAWK